jgi:hypothetical protein
VHVALLVTLPVGAADAEDVVQAIAKVPTTKASPATSQTIAQRARILSTISILSRPDY